MWWRRSESSRFFPRYTSNTQNRGIATSDYTQPAIKKRQPFSKTSMKWITLFALTQTNIVSSAGLALPRPAEHLHAKPGQPPLTFLALVLLFSNQGSYEAGTWRRVGMCVPSSFCHSSPRRVTAWSQRKEAAPAVKRATPSLPPWFGCPLQLFLLWAEFLEISF